MSRGCSHRQAAPSATRSSPAAYPSSSHPRPRSCSSIRRRRRLGGRFGCRGARIGSRGAPTGACRGAPTGACRDRFNGREGGSGGGREGGGSGSGWPAPLLFACAAPNAALWGCIRCWRDDNFPFPNFTVHTRQSSFCLSVLQHIGPVWHSSASPVELFFRKQLHEQLHEWGREPCFGSFTMCLTL
jgi:hypothetical protein